MEIVRFTPYPDSGDPYRGTTVLPYLEAFYQYEAAETVQDRVTELEVFPRHEVQEGNWVSEEEHFGRIDAQSNPSIHSASLYPVDRSLENIAQRKSRVSSQENVLFPMSKSVDGLGPNKLTQKTRKRSRLRKISSKSNCAQQ